MHSKFAKNIYSKSEKKEIYKLRAIKISIFFISIICSASIIFPVLNVLNIKKKNEIIKQEKKKISDFKEYCNGIDETIKNVTKETIYPIEESKINNYSNSSLNLLLNNLYLNQCNGDNFNNYLNIKNQPIEIISSLDSYIRNQKKYFIKKPTGSIDISYKKNIFIPNNQFNFLNFVENKNFFSLLLNIINYLKDLKESNYKLFLSILNVFMSILYKTLYNLQNNDQIDLWKKTKPKFFEFIKSIWENFNDNDRYIISFLYDYFINDQSHYIDLYNLIISNDKQRNFFIPDLVIENLKNLKNIFKKFLKIFPNSVINLYIKYFNNNYNNTYEVNISDWSAHLNKSYVGSLIFVPMWADKIDFYHSAVKYNKIDFEYFNQLITIPFRNLYNKFNSEYKRITEDFFDIFCSYLNLNNNKNFSKLRPMIVVDNNVNSKKIESYDLGNFKLKKLSLNKNEVHITSNNLYKTSINYEKSVCREATCSHNSYGFNRIKHEISKLNHAMLGNDTFLHFMLPILYVMFPIIGVIIDIFASESLGSTSNKFYEFINWSKEFLNKPVVINFFKEFFGVNNYKSIRKIIYDLVLSIYNSWNLLNIDIAHKYSSKMLWHGFDAGKCSTLKVNLQFDTTKYLDVNDKQDLYLYSSSYRKNNISSLFKIENNKINFDKEIIFAIYELANYSELYKYLVSDNSIPTKIKNIIIKNIINLSVPANDLFNQILLYKKKCIEPKIYTQKTSYFKSFYLKGFKIDENLNIDDYKIFKEQILTDIVNQNIYFIDKDNKKYKLFENGKLLNISVNNIKKFNKNNYIFIDFSDTGMAYEKKN